MQNDESGDSVVVIRVGESLATIERRMIEATMKRYGGHREAVAAVLRISLKTLYNRLVQYRKDDDQALLRSQSAEKIAA